MPDVVDDYLDEVLLHASLAPEDERRVRAELKNHLEELLATARARHATQKEALAMLHDEFGKPRLLGKAIGSAKGRLRTYIKKEKRRLPITIVVALGMAFFCQWAVAESFYAKTDAAFPTIPRGSHMLVYKLAGTFLPGDVVVFRQDTGAARFGIVRAVNNTTGALTMARNGEPEEEIARSQVVGKVVLNTR